MEDTIKKITATEILSGIGRPTVEVELVTAKGITVQASVPSGTSRGRYEASEIFDREPRFHGAGVRKVVEKLNTVLAPALIGKPVTEQFVIDQFMNQLDGTENKSNLGGNAILAVSLAVARAGAATLGLPLYRYLGGLGATRLPYPLATVLAGGKHSPSQLDFEDYMLVLNGFDCFSDSLDALAETHYQLGEILRQKFGTVPDVGGAYAPPLNDNYQGLDLLMEAIERAGYGGKIQLGLDIAGSELFNSQKGCYSIEGKEMASDEMIDFYLKLVREYPLVFIEDPFDQDDFESFAKLTSQLPDRQIVGDDLFATNPARLKRGINEGAGNSLLLKVNQIGTLSEAIEAGKMALENNYSVAVSLRSSDTTDSFIADLAVALGAQQIKLGSPVRGERNAKYNRLLRIEQELGAQARIASVL